MPTGRRPTGSLWTEHVSGEMSSGVRRARIDRLLRGTGTGSGERGVLTNARCLTEGVDVPTLDCVAFIDPRRSQVDIVQAVGRAIRKAQDKTVGTIVIPVFVDDSLDAEAALETSEFDRVWQVVKALRAHDEALAEELDELRRERDRRRPRAGRPAKIVLDLPVGIGDAFARAFDAKVVDAATASWEFWFGLLQRFAQRERHMRVPRQPVVDGFKLGVWIAGQRGAYSAGTLSVERTQRLESLPGWSWDPHGDLWEQGFEHLERFVSREGAAAVPTGHLENGYKLGLWLTNQRQRRPTLTVDRQRRLEALPGWIWDPRATMWDEGFLHLARFVEREGHARVPYMHEEKGFKLGAWVNNRRNDFRTGELDAGRVALLQQTPGWAWDARQAQWEEGLSHLRRFVEREGHARVHPRHVEDGFKLGVWVGAQRLRRPSSQRKALLDALPGWVWDARQNDWENGLACLLRYVEREGHALVPQDRVEDGFRLGGWVAGQRSTHRREKLDTDRTARLAAIPGWTWAPYDDAWEQGFQHLERFVEREGHGRVPVAHTEDGFTLGRWVNKQRTNHGRERLSPNRARRLDKLPGWSWDARKSMT